MFSCIKDNLIDEHIIVADNLTEIHSNVLDYKYSNFKGYFLSNTNFRFEKFGTVLMVLSEERSQTGSSYVFHVFLLIENSYTVWVEKFSARTQGYTLRENKPAINLRNSPYIVLIDQSEKVIIFTSD